MNKFFIIYVERKGEKEEYENEQLWIRTKSGETISWPGVTEKTENQITKQGY